MSFNQQPEQNQDNNNLLNVFTADQLAECAMSTIILKNPSNGKCSCGAQFASGQLLSQHLYDSHDKEFINTTIKQIFQKQPTSQKTEYNYYNDGSINNLKQEEFMQSNNHPQFQMKEETQESRARRRARTDPNNRDFICPCGKNYLSYPALYTHIKQKHSGKAPGDVIYPKSGPKGQRGRPKGSEKDENFEYEENDDFQSDESNEALGVIEELIHQITIKFDLVIDKTLLKDNQSYSLQQLENEVFVPSHFQDESDWRPIYNYFIEASHLEIPHGRNYDDEHLLNNNINKVLALFLYALSSHLQIGILQEMVMFVVCLRKALNQYGWQKIGSMPDNDQVQEFCEYNTPKNLLDFFNDFISIYLPEQMQQLDLSQYSIVTPQNINTYLITITEYFGNWL